MANSLLHRSARRIAAEIRHGKLDPCEVADFHLDRITKFNPTVNALTFADEDGVRRRATELRKAQKAGTLRGRLEGVICSVKDAVPVAGMPRSDGTKLNYSPASQHDAALITLLLEEGASIVGKANQAEYGKSYFTDNIAFGRTSNPFDLTRTPGGSGGGDAAAVSLGFASFGIGADSGGSVRVPANFCGLFGMYLTQGSVTARNLASVNHTLARLFRSPGPLANSREDCEVLLEILRKFDPKDPTSGAAPHAAVPAGKKFAFFTSLNGVKCDPEISQSLAATVKALEAAGYHGEEQTLAPFQGAYEIFIVLAGQASLILEDMLSAERGTPRVPAQEGPLMQRLRSRIASELPPLTVERLLRCWYEVDRLRHAATPIFDEYAFVLAPVAACVAPPHGTALFDVAGIQLQSQQVFQFASAVNVLGLPSVAFPTGLSAGGLPIGLQLIGPRFRERMLLKVLKQIGIEKAIVPQDPKIAPATATK